MTNLLLQAAMARLDHWQAELKTATEAGNADRTQECARFVEEYQLLLATTVENALK